MQCSIMRSLVYLLLLFVTVACQEKPTEPNKPEVYALLRANLDSPESYRIDLVITNTSRHLLEFDKLIIKIGSGLIPNSSIVLVEYPAKLKNESRVAIITEWLPSDKPSYLQRHLSGNKPTALQEDLRNTQLLWSLPPKQRLVVSGETGAGTSHLFLFGDEDSYIIIGMESAGKRIATFFTELPTFLSTPNMAYSIGKSIEEISNPQAGYAHVASLVAVPEGYLPHLPNIFAPNHLNYFNSAPTPRIASVALDTYSAKVAGSQFFGGKGGAVKLAKEKANWQCREKGMEALITNEIYSLREVELQFRCQKPESGGAPEGNATRLGKELNIIGEAFKDYNSSGDEYYFLTVKIVNTGSAVFQFDVAELTHFPFVAFKRNEKGGYNAEPLQYLSRWYHRIKDKSGGYKDVTELFPGEERILTFETSHFGPHYNPVDGSRYGDHFSLVLRYKSSIVAGPFPGVLKPTSKYPLYSNDSKGGIFLNVQHGVVF